jgi:glycosyltransferase involved in cell wall biosynthesis
MKTLVFAHKFEVGGSQVNAIDLTAALRDRHGHDVAIFATPGPMVRVARERGLRFIPAPDVSTYPSRAMMAALRRVVHQERPDVIHAWDWWQFLDALFAVHLPMRVPLVVSDMVSDGINRFMPKRLPLTFGTPELADRARAGGRRDVSVLLPPVDTTDNAPGAVDGGPLRRELEIGPDELVLVTVSRIVLQLKSESIRRTIDAVRQVGREAPIRFVAVGDGNAREDLEARARAVNDALGRQAIVFTGEMIDPRAAYDMADIVVGMGGSALRGMAFAKPVVVVGEQGFCELMRAESADYFLYYGLYGRGDGDPENARMSQLVRRLAAEREEFPALGQFGREFVVRNFGVPAVAAELDRLLREAVATTHDDWSALRDALRTGAIRFGRRFIPDVVRRYVAGREELQSHG